MKNYNYGGRSFAAGGAMPMEQLTEFNEGGRHEENSLGGIPQGMNPEGQMNLVEEGETKFDAENYIYSDSLKVDKELAEAFNLAPKMVGKTFADASKMAGRKKSKRQGDAIETAANEKDLSNLMEAQEAFKQARIEEKLQEIAELDPNALPALMGQGQPQEGAPQGDPAMGGQMQEAPMDEQAMMEQQMMAEQQGGGGQPSPEEMAMMEQQQNQMMGQQEGMMRAGGKLPKEVLKARAQSHMSPAQADAYVENYAKGGKMDFEPHIMYKDGNGIQADTYQKHLSLKNEGYGHSMGYGGYTKKRSYAPGGFMGANAGMMTPGPCGTPGNPPCPGEETGFSTVNVDRDTATSGTAGLGSMKFDSNLGFGEADSEIQALQQKLRQDMLSNKGAYISTPPPTNFGGSGKKDSIPKEKIPEELNNPNISEKTSNSTLNPPRRGIFRQINQANKHNWWSKNIGQHFKAQTQKQRVKTPGIFHNRKRRGLEFGGNLMQSGQEAGINPMQGMNQAFNMGGMLDGGLAGQNLNLNQGLASQMRRGGKMCYGCGGKMHAYGGRMNGMNQMATGGEIVSGIGSGLYGVGEGLLDTLTFGLTDELTDRGYDALQEIGPMKGEDNVGDAIRGGANAAGAVAGAALTGGAATGSAVAQGSKGIGDSLGAIGEETENENLGKIGKGVSGAGQVAGMFIGGGGAGSAASSAGSVAAGAGAGTMGAAAKAADGASKAANAAKTAKFAKVGKIASNEGVQAGLNMGTQALENSTAKAEAERLAEEEKVRMEREMMMTNDPTSPYYNPTTELPAIPFAGGGYMGANSYRTGGRPGLWANIQAKKERMGSNYRPAQPGNPDRPTAKALKNSQNAMGGRMYYPGGQMQFMPNFAGPEINDKKVKEETETKTKTDEFNDMYPNIDAALEQTPLQKAALYAPIAKNLYDATLAKSDDYNPEFIPAEYVQLDSAQAIQQEKQRNAGLVAAGRAKGFNNPSTMLALNHALQGTVSNIQSSYDAKNSMLKQAALTSNNTQKKELAKLKQSLKMQTAEAKNLAMNEALSQAKQIAENKTSNKLSALYATMGAPDMGKNFITDNNKYKKLQKEFKKLQKEIKALKNQ